MNVVGPQAFVARAEPGAGDRPVARAAGRPDRPRRALPARSSATRPSSPIVDAWTGSAGRRPGGAGARPRAAAGTSSRTDPALQGWPSWNLTRERARAALARWEATRRLLTGGRLPAAGSAAVAPARDRPAAARGGATARTAGRPTARPADRRPGAGSPAATRCRTRSRRTTIAWRPRSASRSPRRRRSPGSSRLRLLDLDDLEAEGRHERAVRDLVLERRALCRRAARSGRGRRRCGPGPRAGR